MLDIYPIGQCNNAFIFPGLGLGVVAAKATRVNNEMLVACAKVISECAQINRDPSLSLLPSLTDINDVSYKIAYATAKTAQETGVAPVTSEQEIHDNIHANTWSTSYVRYSYKESIDK